MKKGCLIALVAVPLLLLIIAGIGAFVADRQYGWTMADPVPHEQFAEPETRLRVSAKLDTLVDIFEATIPPGSIPSWLPVSAGGVIPEVLPHEIAVLGGADYRENVYQLRVVVNERRGGPVVAQQLNDSGTFKDVSVVRWDPKGMRAEGRGVLIVEGSLPLEENLETRLLEQFPTAAPAQPMKLEGGHLLEVALDNTNGDLYTIVSAMQFTNGVTMAELEENAQVKAGLDMLPGIFNLRLALDRTGDDELTLQLHAEADAATGSMLQLMLGGFGMGYIKPQLKRQYNMDIEGSVAYDEPQQALTGKFTLTGFKEPLLKSLKGQQR